MTQQTQQGQQGQQGQPRARARATAGTASAAPHDDTSSGQRPLDEIADEIQSQWRTLTMEAVAPVAAMRQLRHIDDAYGSRAGRAVVRDFLGSAASWRGPAARRIKAELKTLLEDQS